MNQKQNLHRNFTLFLVFLFFLLFSVAELGAHEVPENLPINLTFKKIHPSGVYMQEDGVNYLGLYFVYEKELDPIPFDMDVDLKKMSDTKSARYKNKKVRHFRSRIFRLKELPVFFFDNFSYEDPPNKQWLELVRNPMYDPDYDYVVSTHDSSPFVAVTKTISQLDSQGGEWTKVYNLKGELIKKFKSGGKPVMSPEGNLIFTLSGGVGGHKTQVFNMKKKKVKEFEPLFYYSIEFDDQKIYLRHGSGGLTAIFNREGKLLDKIQQSAN